MCITRDYISRETKESISSSQERFLQAPLGTDGSHCVKLKIRISRISRSFDFFPQKHLSSVQTMTNIDKPHIRIMHCCCSVSSHKYCRPSLAAVIIKVGVAVALVAAAAVAAAVVVLKEESKKDCTRGTTVLSTPFLQQRLRNSGRIVRAVSGNSGIRMTQHPFSIKGTFTAENIIAFETGVQPSRRKKKDMLPPVMDFPLPITTRRSNVVSRGSPRLLQNQPIHSSIPY